MRRISLALTAFIVLLASSARAQNEGYFRHMDLGISAASTGIGANVKMPVGNFVDVRLGFSYMPRFKFKSDYSILVGGVGRGSLDSKFDKAAGMLQDFTGYEVDDQIGMTKQLRLWNFQFLVDIKPIPNYKQFHFTVGFYAGPERVAKAFNAAEEGPSLVAVGMYNALYERVCLQEPLFASTALPAIELTREQSQKIAGFGMMGARLGTFADGDKAIVVPDKNGMITSRMLANKFRPYVGVGWETNLGKGSKYKFSIDAGCYFWGGSPQLKVDNVYKVNFDRGYDLVAWKWTNSTTGESVLTAPYAPRPTATEGRFVQGNDGYVVAQPQTIDMVKDIDVTRKDIGGIVSLARKLKVYPVVSITFSRRIF